MKQKTTYIALYGNIGIKKGWCEECESFAFVIDNEISCCGTRFEDEPEKYKRECEPEQKRKALSLSERQRQLEEQNYKCYYCEKTFGSFVCRKGKLVRLKVNYDHLIPYSLSQDNFAANFVAACHICNGIKSDFYFQTLDEAKVFIQQRWSEKGYKETFETEEMILY